MKIVISDTEKGFAVIMVRAEEKEIEALRKQVVHLKNKFDLKIRIIGVSTEENQTHGIEHTFHSAI